MIPLQAEKKPGEHLLGALLDMRRHSFVIMKIVEKNLQF